MTEQERAAELERHLRGSARIMAVLRAAREVALPDHRLLSGAVYQTVWNALTGRAPDYGIADYDVAYFSADLSEAAEADWQERMRAAVGPELAARVEVVNQARVHLWFERVFGQRVAPLADTDSALPRFLSTAHAAGVRLEADGSLSVTAPFGLGDVFSMTLRPNPRLNQTAKHLAKATGVLARWPEARLLPEQT
jgi:uncharacterized protein